MAYAWHGKEGKIGKKGYEGRGLSRALTKGEVCIGEYVLGVRILTSLYFALGGGGGGVFGVSAGALGACVPERGGVCPFRSEVFITWRTLSWGARPYEVLCFLGGTSLSFLTQATIAEELARTVSFQVGTRIG